MLYQLSYSRILSSTNPKKWWGGKDSNLRRHQPTDLQSALVDRLSTSPRLSHLWSWREESNLQPGDYKSPALPLSHASRRKGELYMFALHLSSDFSDAACGQSTNNNLGSNTDFHTQRFQLSLPNILPRLKRLSKLNMNLW